MRTLRIHVPALACALVALVAAAAPARAEKAAVVVASPEERRESRSLVDDVARKRIELQHWTVAETGPLTATEIRDMVVCLDARRPAGAAPTATPPSTRECARDVVGQVVADRLLVMSVAADSKRAEDTIVSAWLLDGTGDLIAATSQRCDRCRPILLEQVTSDMFATLWREARARSGLATLQIRSIPAGATIEIDGKEAGATDADIDVKPGSHRVVLRKDGFEDATRTVEAKHGETVPVPVELVAAGAVVDGGTAAPERPILIPAIVAGAGAAALVTGIVFIAIDEDPTSTGKIDDHYRDSAPSGVAVAALGLTAIGAGVAWYFLAPELGESPTQGPAAGPIGRRRWAPTTAPVAGGWSLGVVGRF